MTQLFTPPDPASLVMYEEALTQPGLYLRDELVPEWALLERHIQPGKAYTVFLMCEYTASRPMGMVPYKRPWKDDAEQGSDFLALDDVEESSGRFCIGTFNHIAGTITVETALHNKDIYIAELKKSTVQQFPQVLSITLIGIFAQTLPVPVPPRPSEEEQ